MNIQKLASKSRFLPNKFSGTGGGAVPPVAGVVTVGVESDEPVVGVDAGELVPVELELVLVAALVLEILVELAVVEILLVLLVEL